MSHKKIYQLAVAAVRTIRENRDMYRTHIMSRFDKPETIDAALIRKLIEQDNEIDRDLWTIIMSLETKRMCCVIHGQNCYGTKRCPIGGCFKPNEKRGVLIDPILTMLEGIEKCQSAEASLKT